MQPDIDYLMGQDIEKLRKSSALFLLKMKDKRRISQVAIDDVVEHCRSLADNIIIRCRCLWKIGRCRY